MYYRELREEAVLLGVEVKRRSLHIAQYDFAVQMKPLPPDGEAILSELSQDRILHIHSCNCQKQKIYVANKIIKYSQIEI